MHLIQKLEGSKEKISFVRVDSDHIDNLIKKDDTKISKLSDDEKKKLEDILKEEIPSDKFTVQLESMDSEADPFIITQPEFMRRMKEMHLFHSSHKLRLSNNKRISFTVHTFKLNRKFVGRNFFF